MKKYSDELIALMGCVAKMYVDGTQAANMLKAVLNLKTVDPESFRKEYLEQSLRAADALMEELDTADPELPISSGSLRKAPKQRTVLEEAVRQTESSPPSHSAREAEDSSGALRLLTARSATLLGPPGREEERNTTTGESTSAGREKLPKSESRDSAGKGRTPDTLSAGRISLTWASTQTCQARSLPSTSSLSLTGMPEQARSRYMYGYSALLGRTVL